VTVGDVICFALPLKTKFGDVGHWSSSNSEVLLIEEDTGIARAVAPGGPVLVQYHLAGEFVSSTEIDVFPISSVRGDSCFNVFTLRIKARNICYRKISGMPVMHRMQFLDYVVC